MRTARSCIIGIGLALWMGSATASDRPVVGVATFTNRSQAGWWGDTVGKELAEMLAGELGASGRFVVVEVAKLRTEFGEADPSEPEMDAIEPHTEVPEAEFVVMATVTGFGRTGGRHGGFHQRGAARGVRSDDAWITVEIRVVKTSSGSTEHHVPQLRAQSGRSGVNLGIYRGGFGQTLSHYHRTATGRAIRGVIMEISDYLSCVMVERSGCEARYVKRGKP